MVVNSSAMQLLEIESDETLQKRVAILPGNYDFEISKTILRIRTTKSKYVALQFPEGLLLYSCIISDILEEFTGCRTVIMGDVTYGACCVDDYTARALGCDLLVHYGHSCLVPIQNTDGINMLYVLVSIKIDASHFLDVYQNNFKKEQKVAVVTTIQFVGILQSMKSTLSSLGYGIIVPQCKPLSPGEILGCTSPRLDSNVDALVYLGDGRFHLESIMLHNPQIPAFQYDPYSRLFTKEIYDINLLMKTRLKSIEMARKSKFFGLIQGTLGRQGNIKIFEDLEKRLVSAGKKCIRILISEISPKKLALFDDVDCWVQVACPRLSIDWSSAFDKPILTPYELVAALDQVKFPTDHYAMDYYSYDSLGPWTNNHESHLPARPKRRHIPISASNL